MIPTILTQCLPQYMPQSNHIQFVKVSGEEISERCIRLSVYDFDKKKSTKHLIGHALVNLSDFDPSKADEILWRDLDDIAHVIIVSFASWKRYFLHLSVKY